MLERLIQSRQRTGLRITHLGILTLLMAVCALLYYIDQTPLVNVAPFNHDIFTTVHDLHRTLFMVPVIYAAIVFRFRGALITSAVFLAIVLPRALFLSTYPEPLVRPLLFVVTAALVSSLIAYQLNYIEARIRITGTITRIRTDMTELEKERGNLLNFMNMAAHDLKSPLAAIQSYNDVLLGGYTGELTEKQRNMLERTNSRAGELRVLIDNLLDISRLEAGQLARETEDFSLTEEIRRCLDELGILAQRKGLELALEPALGRDFPMHGSPTRIRQALTNLVGNAIKYTPAGKVTISLRDNSDHVQVDITDTGIGIPADELPRVFDDFYRAGNAAAEGTGLGLAITRRIIASHGGRIWVTSPDPETGTGSRFSFTLPFPAEKE